MCVNDKAGAAAAMDTASASQEDSEEPGSSTTSGSFLYPEMTDPFVHHLELATTYDKIKVRKPQKSINTIFDLIHGLIVSFHVLYFQCFNQLLLIFL